MTAEQIIVPGAEKPLSVLVTSHEKSVVLHFSQPREYAAFNGSEPVVIGTQMLTQAIVSNPESAKSVIDMAMAVIDFAYEMRGDLKPAGGAVKHELIERHRKTLTRRLEVVMNTQRERRKVSNAELSKQLTDIVLSEVFS